MAPRPDPGSRPGRYYVGFTLTATVLTGLTLFLVLFVLPRRYVLSAGLREAGLSFPSQAAPFTPATGTPRAAAPAPPPPVVRGPAEILWAQVGPLIAAERYDEAIPLFASYLAASPEDRGVRREYALTLNRAGRPDLAVAQFERLLPDGEYPGLRLLAARTLRDAGQMRRASSYYASLLEERPRDVAVGLEWGRSLAWSGDHVGAAGVLERVLEANPESVEVKIALAEVYYWAGLLEESAALLATLDAETLEAVGALALRDDVIAALTPPPEEVVPVPPPTLRQRAEMAMAEEDWESAASFYRLALEEAPGDAALWVEYADLLQYRLEDLEGAREALLQAEALVPDDASIDFRLAQLAIWTDRSEEAKTRLDRLLAIEDPQLATATPLDSTRFAQATAAEMRAMLGDINRWEGDRFASNDNYRMALAADSTNPRAREGFAELEVEIQRDIKAAEDPGVGGTLSTLSDSDEFSHLELGAQAKDVRDEWAWSARTGSRWIAGIGSGGLDQSERGFFLDLEGGRWWRLGTVRTGLSFGSENTRPQGTDLSFGASLVATDISGFRADLAFVHGPAYPLTVTLQSMLARTMQDRLTATLVRAMTERWSLVMVADGAWLDAKETGGQETEGSLRLEGALSLERRLVSGLSLGATGRVMGYSNPSPVVDGIRLFWDPSALYSAGVYAGWSREVRAEWSLRARFQPSLAWIDERQQVGFELVPHLSAEAGFTHTGSRFRTGLDVFYYQGRFDGYRAYGLRMTFSAIDWLGRRRAR